MLTDITTLLTTAKTIAIIGAKDKPGQPVDTVGHFLIAQGYKVIPVHPTRSNVWGLKTYAKLTDIEEPIDIVDVFRAPEFCLAHAEETIQLKHKPMAFWMQLGIKNAEAQELVTSHGIMCVDNKCTKIEYQKLPK